MDSLFNTDIPDANSLYTDEVRYFVHNEQQAFPKGLVFDVVEYNTHLAIRFYRDNFETFDGEDKKQISTTVGHMINKIRQDGIPCYLEVAPNAPREQQ